MYIMKTIITIIGITLLASGYTMKKDPSVTVISGGQYIIIVDGKRFDYEKKIHLEKMKSGEHYIDVFEKRKSLFGKKYKLVSSKQFIVDKKDIHIAVNNTGYIMIGKQEKGWDGDYWMRDIEKRKSEKKNKQ